MALLPSGLPKFCCGLYRRTVTGVLHCCLLSSGFCLFQPQPAKQHITCCAVMLPAAQGSAFFSGVHNTRSTTPSCPQNSETLHLLTCPWPLPFSSTHPGPIKQHYLQRAGTPHPLCCGVQHTPCCAARQHLSRWFYWDTILPSVSLPNTQCNQNLLKQTKTFYQIL